MLLYLSYCYSDLFELWVLVLWGSGKVILSKEHHAFFQVGVMYKAVKILDLQPTRDFRLVNLLPVLPEIIPVYYFLYLRWVKGFEVMLLLEHIKFNVNALEI